MAAKEKFLNLKNRYDNDSDSAFEALGIFISLEGNPDDIDTNTACGCVVAKTLLVLSGDMPGE